MPPCPFPNGKSCAAAPLTRFERTIPAATDARSETCAPRPPGIRFSSVSPRVGLLADVPAGCVPQTYGLDASHGKTETGASLQADYRRRKMKRLKDSIRRMGILFSLLSVTSRMHAANITVDGSQTNQYVDGFGVNANYWSYTNG